jgi:hypothetical protein
VSRDKELWKTGKSVEDVDGEETENDETIDLSSPSPDTDKEDEEIDLGKIEDSGQADEDSGLPLLREEDGVSIRTVGLVGTITVLLLTAVLVLLLYDPKIVIEVPYEKYEEKATYDVEGVINFESTVDVPLPIGFIDNDVVINDLDISFSGELKAGIKAPSTQSMDGYGDMHSVFKKYLEQRLDHVEGTITEEGENPAELKNGQIESFQHQFVNNASLKIIRSEIESNASYSDTLAGNRWYWQSATDWVPRDSSTGLLPHGSEYIGRTLEEGSTGIANEKGIEFNWKVEDGGRISGEQTALLKVWTSYVSDSILGYQYQYEYAFYFYMSEISSLPLKFEMSLYSDASSPGGKLYSISMEYKGTANQIEEGYKEIPTTATKTDSTQKTGQFEDWVNGAPALGNGNSGYDCGIDSNFNLQTGIQKGMDEITEFDDYLRYQNGTDRPAFVVEANYTNRNEGKWNFTMTHSDEQAENTNGWFMTYSRSNISGEKVDSVDNPILTMDDIPEPLTVCSAEEVMTDFDEINSWSVDDKTKTVNYTQVNLLLGQNLVSKQSLTSPISIVNFGSLNLINIVSDLSQGNLRPSDYSDNIDVDAAGSYAYFLDRKGNDKLGNSHQELAAVDAKDGLVLFNLQAMSST